MAVREVLRMGHPVLAQVAQPVEDFGPELEALLADMKDTMAAEDGAGLAAPQIGVSRRVDGLEGAVEVAHEHVTRVVEVEGVRMVLRINEGAGRSSAFKRGPLRYVAAERDGRLRRAGEVMEGERPRMGLSGEEEQGVPGGQL